MQMRIAFGISKNQTIKSEKQTMEGIHGCAFGDGFQVVYSQVRMWRRPGYGLNVVVLGRSDS